MGQYGRPKLALAGLLVFGRPDLATLPKSCNLLGGDLGYSEATDQVR